MIHGGDIYRNKIEYDFSVNVNPFKLPDILMPSMDDLERVMGIYPDEQCEEIRAALSKRYGVKPKHIVCGNGASDLFLGIVRGINPKKALIMSPTFYGYEYALKNAEIISYKLKEEAGFSIDEGILDCMDEDIDLMFIGNPENPAGKLIDKALLKSILNRGKQLGIIIVLDECFYELSQGMIREDTDSLISEYKNLCIINAFTKSYGIPGIRLGYLFCGDEDLILNVKNNLSEWNVSGIAQLMGTKLSNDVVFIKDSAKRIAIEREYVTKSLIAMGMRVYSFDANFLLVYSEMDIYKGLLDKKILIKDCKDTKGLRKGFYRIAIKDRKSNEYLINSLRNIMRDI